jgi:hypothetical protein
MYCKVLESLVREHIIEFMKRNNFFTRKEYGFIFGQSTALQLLEVIDKWTEALDLGFQMLHCAMQISHHLLPLAALSLIGNCRSRLLVVHVCHMMLTCYVVAYVRTT